MKSNLSESVLVDHLAPSASRLPPLWSVIYEEAVRGNHILFEEADLETFQEQSLPEQDDAEIAWVVTYVAQMSTCTSLIELKKAIAELSPSKRGLVFVLYMNAIQLFTIRLKRSLN